MWKKFNNKGRLQTARCEELWLDVVFQFRSPRGLALLKRYRPQIVATVDLLVCVASHALCADYVFFLLVPLPFSNTSGIGACLQARNVHELIGLKNPYPRNSWNENYVIS